MTFVIYTTIISPHVVPFVEEVRRLCPKITVKYISRGFAGLRPVEKIKAKKGWDSFYKLDYTMNASDDWNLTWRLLRECDVLFCGFRETALFEERIKAGKLTYYTGERWLKPYVLVNKALFWGTFRIHVQLPGIFRMFVPHFRDMVKRFVRLTEHERFVFLPIGTYAARDVARLRRLAYGDWCGYFRCPKVPLEKRVMAVVDGCRQVCLWGYYVDQSSNPRLSNSSEQHGERSEEDLKKRPLRLLWVGRMLDWKRIDTVIKVVKGDERFQLTLLGDGEEKVRLVRLADDAPNIEFHDPEDLPGVRRMMREHDILILSSSIREGWGAVVSEALEEGMKVVGTYEAGSSSTVLPDTNLFHAGDVNGLRRVLLSSKIVVVSPEAWSARRAAAEFIKDMEARLGK